MASSEKIRRETDDLIGIDSATAIPVGALVEGFDADRADAGTSERPVKAPSDVCGMRQFRGASASSDEPLSRF